uniref:centrosomal protein of 55 kDa isoform X2 n=1 Tax=Scatophagus argus TaxID=75038 RepID=UPI001ED7DDD1|nr:centrosomal protein of 55 kDa isoform X2 [Scatophagus argus]
MASLKYKHFHRKNPNAKLVLLVSGLRKENAYLKKTLVELSRQHSEHNKLLERFLSLETVRLEKCQPLMTKDERTDLPSDQLKNKEVKQTDVVSGSTSDDLAPTNNVTELQNHLSDALEKNKQWLEYDQQREAYVRAILARMLWLEKQLNEANQALSQQHNEDHSDENEQISQMQEHYESLLQKSKDELEVLREQVDMTHQNLIKTQKLCEERQSEVEELKQLLQTEEMSRKSAADDHCATHEEQHLRDEPKDLQHRLDEEKCRSTNFELQIKISSQDLEDERQDCSYLKKQMVRVLKALRKNKHSVTAQSKRVQLDSHSCEAAHPPSSPSRDSLTSSLNGSLLNESFLECPSCQTAYPASQYRELMNHLEICLD